MKPKFWGGRPDPDPQSRVRAGLVTEMKERKHYYAKGVEARIGIEK